MIGGLARTTTTTSHTSIRRSGQLTKTYSSISGTDTSTWRTMSLPVYAAATGRSFATRSLPRVITSVARSYSTPPVPNPPPTTAPPDKPSTTAKAAAATVQEAADQTKAATSSAAKSAADQTTKAAASHAAQQAANQAKAATSHAAQQAARYSESSRKSKGSAGPITRLVSYTLFLFGSTFLVTYYLDSRSAIHRWVAMPFLHSFVDAEEAQKLAITLLKSGLAPKDYTQDDESLSTSLFGQKLSNPLGLAAGFDKQGEAIDGLFDLGFGLVEIGSVTPEPQPGNPKPRYFRIPSESASINRFGFNSDGHAVVLERLLDRVRTHLIKHPHLIPSNYLADPKSPSADPRLSRHEAIEAAATELTRDPHTVAALLDHHGLQRSLRPGRLLSVNLGKNKTSSEEDPNDFISGVKTFGPLADMLVVNVSSPNTPGLRDLQKKEALQTLLSQLVQTRDSLPPRAMSSVEKVPLVVKISPDLTPRELEDVCSVIIESGIDGVIISNTTIQRPQTDSMSETELNSTLKEMGGLSGPPLRPISRRALRQIAGTLKAHGKEVIASGGISSPDDVRQAIKEDGASLVQVYTAFGWQGVGMVARWKEALKMQKGE
ncbi:unnamed protein product [Sympodiomycopsis kandeliae]